MSYSISHKVLQILPCEFRFQFYTRWNYISIVTLLPANIPNLFKRCIIYIQDEISHCKYMSLAENAIIVGGLDLFFLVYFAYSFYFFFHFCSTSKKASGKFKEWCLANKRLRRDTWENGVKSRIFIKTRLDVTNRLIIGRQISF